MAHDHKNNFSIPWAPKQGFSLDQAIDELLEVIPEVNRHQYNILYKQNTAIIRTPLQIGISTASVVTAFGILLQHWVNQHPTLKRNLADIDQTLQINIKNCELLNASIFLSRVNGKRLMASTFMPKSFKQHHQMGLLKAGSYLQIAQTKDKHWFHSHGNFNCDTIQKELQCRPIRNSVTNAIKKRDALELESSLDKCNALGVMVRTPQQWANHDHGRHLLGLPPVEIKKIADGEPLHSHDIGGSNSSGTRPLLGLKVLDLTRVLAGPSSSRILSAFGADVLKITSPKLPFYPFFAAVENLGKRSASLDFQKEGDLNQLFELAKTADVFVDSYRANSFSNFGITPAALARHSKRGIIYVTISCFGSGPWQEKGGYDSLAQAATGFAAAHSGYSEKDEPRTVKEKPEFMPMSAPNDYIAGYMAAYGILAALLKRQQEGGSYHVKVSLAQSAMWTLKFGYRPRPNRPSTLRNLVTPNFYDAKTNKDGEAYLISATSEFGDIELIQSPLQITGTNICEAYEQPSVTFGSHHAEWATE